MDARLPSRVGTEISAPSAASVKQQGIPNINGRGRGDLIFKVAVEVPKNLTGAQKDALRKFAEQCGKGNYSKKEKFFSKIFGKDSK